MRFRRNLPCVVRSMRETDVLVVDVNGVKVYLRTVRYRSNRVKLIVQAQFGDVKVYSDKNVTSDLPHELCQSDCQTDVSEGSNDSKTS